MVNRGQASSGKTKGHAKDFGFYYESNGEYRSILKPGCTQHGEIYVFHCPFWPEVPSVLPKVKCRGTE